MVREHQPPIFIVGTGRSGSTLLRLMLCAHPRIHLSHEPSLYLWQQVYGRFRPFEAFVQDYFQTFSFRWLGLDPDELLAGLPRPLQRQHRGLLVRRILEAKADLCGKARIGDKTPGQLTCLGPIFRDFPDAQVIHITRHPYDTVASLRTMPWASSATSLNAVGYRWAMRRARPFEDRILSIRLEDLLAEPEATMRRVVGYVGEDWDAVVLDHARHLPAGADMPPLTWLQPAATPRQVGGARASRPLSLPEQRVVRHLCGRSMSRYGYEARAGGRDLSAWDRVRLWSGIVLGVISQSATGLRMLSLLRRPGPRQKERIESLLGRFNPEASLSHPGLAEFLLRGPLRAAPPRDRAPAAPHRSRFWGLLLLLVGFAGFSLLT